jgi:hypothetical protein
MPQISKQMMRMYAAGMHAPVQHPIPEGSINAV